MVPLGTDRSAFALLLLLLTTCEARTETSVSDAPTSDWTEREAWTGRVWPRLESPGSEEYPPLLSAQVPLARARPDHVRLEGGWPLLRPTLTLFHPHSVGGDRRTIGTYADEAPRDETAEFVESFCQDTEAARRLGRPWVGFRADRRVPWVRVSRWIQILAREPAHVSTILLECATVPNGGWGSMVAELRPASPPGSTPIRLHVLNAGEDPGIRVDLGEAAWTFPAGPPYTGKDRVGRANEHWRAILAVLQRRAATTRDPLTVNPDEGVPWAYVVQVLSIACASGPTIVSLPASDTQLEVRLDEGGSDAATALLRVARGDSYGLTAPTWVTVGLLSGGVIGALLFLVRSRRRTGARA